MYEGGWYMRYLTFLISFFALAGSWALRFATFTECQVSEHLNEFRGEDVVVLYRGLHFCPDIFTNQEKQNAYVSSHVPGVDYIECNHICKSIANIQKFSYEKPNSECLLRQQLLNTSFMFNRLKRLQESNGMILRESYYDKSHKYYSAHYSSDNSDANLLSCVNRAGTQFLANPFLSFSKHPTHAVKYGYGIGKKYVGHKKLGVIYYDGVPINSTLGVFQVILLKSEDIYKLGVCDVNAQIGRPPRRIYTEEEVSLEGFAAPSNFIIQGKMKLPNLFNRAECNAIGLKQIRSRWIEEGISEKILVQHFSDSLENYVADLLDSEGINKVELNEI